MAYVAKPLPTKLSWTNLEGTAHISSIFNKVFGLLFQAAQQNKSQVIELQKTLDLIKTIDFIKKKIVGW